MPPFFPLILSQWLHSDVGYLAGWAYVLPTLLTALSGPWWGGLADRFGKKALLLRAQLGLAASFLLAGFADSVPIFLVALAFSFLSRKPDWPNARRLWRGFCSGCRTSSTS